jgi:hypothetical protein
MGGGKEICSKGTPKIIKHWGKKRKGFCLWAVGERKVRHLRGVHQTLERKHMTERWGGGESVGDCVGYWELCEKSHLRQEERTRRRRRWVVVGLTP